MKSPDGRTLFAEGPTKAVNMLINWPMWEDRNLLVDLRYLSDSDLTPLCRRSWAVIRVKKSFINIALNTLQSIARGDLRGNKRRAYNGNARNAVRTVKTEDE